MYQIFLTVYEKLDEWYLLSLGWGGGLGMGEIIKNKNKSHYNKTF